ncbi:MAG: type VII toxin-antitoxin system MntA family adenylyltransferase antitoxin [Planctomycetota bacterium]|jgi:predicted nucleotidyltransferase
MDRDAVASCVRRVLADHDAVAAAYLFGSVAKRTSKPDSDVDVAVLYDRPPPSTLGSPQMKLEAALEKVLRRPVQVICLNSVPPDLGIRVLRHGMLLTENDRSARIRFEVRLRNEFWDLEPILRLCRKRKGAAT